MVPGSGGTDTWGAGSGGIQISSRVEIVEPGTCWRVVFSAGGLIHAFSGSRGGWGGLCTKKRASGSRLVITISM